MSSLSPECHLILLFSMSVSGLWDTGTHLIKTEVVHSLTIDVPPYPSMKADFSFLIHWTVAKLLSSYMTPQLGNHLAPIALGSSGPCDSGVIIHKRASLAFATSSCLVSSPMWLGSVEGSESISTCSSLTLDLAWVLRCEAGSQLFSTSAYVVHIRPSS